MTAGTCTWCSRPTRRMVYRCVTCPITSMPFYGLGASAAVAVSCGVMVENYSWRSSSLASFRWISKNWTPWSTTSWCVTWEHSASHSARFILPRDRKPWLRVSHGRPANYDPYGWLAVLSRGLGLWYRPAPFRRSAILKIRILVRVRVRDRVRVRIRVSQ